MKEFGVFTYDNETDECLYQSYFDSKIRAVEFAKQHKGDAETENCYIEVWRKENGLWGNTGEPIYKTD